MRRQGLSLYIGLMAILLMVLMFRGLKLFTGSLIASEDFNIYITHESSSQSILDDISNKDANAHLTGLRLLLRMRGYDKNIHTGCYHIRKGYNAKNIFDILTSGMQTPVKVVINSTRTVSQMAKNISQQLMMDSLQVYECLTDSTALDSMGYSINTVFALIIPDTYEFYWNVSPDGFLKRMSKEHDRFWNEQRRAKAADIGLSPLEVTTLASIIEEETSIIEELPIVAGLYINRLRKGMPLQADPTVIFALGGERPKRVLKTYLDVDSPYNTYKHSGLPPAPIRFADKTSIDAVLNYTHHIYLYMCAKEDFSGYHNFATTLSSHNINAQKYQRALSRSQQ